MLNITDNFQHLHHFSRAPFCAENSNRHNGSDLEQHRCSNLVILRAEHGYSCCMSTDIAATGRQVDAWFRLYQYGTNSSQLEWLDTSRESTTLGLGFFEILENFQGQGDSFL